VGQLRRDGLGRSGVETGWLGGIWPAIIFFRFRIPFPFTFQVGEKIK
jgi:hypothetical protein